MTKCDIEKEFERSDVIFMAEARRNGEPVACHLDGIETVAFNLWSYLTKAEPLFDEICIRVATAEEIREFVGSAD